jgi:hypothetical protein
MDLKTILIVDPDAALALPAIVRWLENHAPAEAIGSYDKVGQWITRHHAAAELESYARQRIRDSPLKVNR